MLPYDGGFDFWVGNLGYKQAPTPQKQTSTHDYNPHDQNTAQHFLSTPHLCSSTTPLLNLKPTVKTYTLPYQSDFQEELFFTETTLLRNVI